MKRAQYLEKRVSVMEGRARAVIAQEVYQGSNSAVRMVLVGRVVVAAEMGGLQVKVELGVREVLLPVIPSLSAVKGVVFLGAKSAMGELTVMMALMS